MVEENAVETGSSDGGSINSGKQTTETEAKAGRFIDLRREESDRAMAHVQAFLFTSPSPGAGLQYPTITIPIYSPALFFLFFDERGGARGERAASALYGLAFVFIAANPRARPPGAARPRGLDRYFNFHFDFDQALTGFDFASAMKPKAVGIGVILPLLSGAAAFQHRLLSPSPVAARSAERRPSAIGLLPPNAGVVGGDEDSGGDDLAASRRSFLARSLAAVAGSASLILSPPLSYAVESKTAPYEDPDYGFRLQIPASWESSEQKLSDRRKAIFFTDPTSKDADTGTIETLGFIAYTPVRDDFTSLGSFGSVDEVAQTTILPKGKMAMMEDDSKMLSAVSKNSAYYFDYVTTPVVPTAPGSGGTMTKTLKKQHFRTIFTLLPLKDYAGMTLVTITLQTTEERYGDLKGMFDGVVESFGKM